LIGDDDPGWPRLPSLLVMLVPGVGLRRVQETNDGLLAMRLIFVSFATAIVLIGVAVAFVAGDAPGERATPWLVALAAIAAASVVLSAVVERPLDCSSAERLAATYRQRFFVRLAFAESVALFGFVFAFLEAPAWVYYVAGAFTLFRFFTHGAPTRAALGRDQDRLTLDGCGRSLVAELRAARA
jgi:F0F1-type ATP synthase membrane subunit c/vacuolar-type H+-ATPase subunit K